ncbi:hypothetical protein H2201_008106 [Coniosporium apollinis]|uniref:Rhodopsin domain-containing protein n=1 Tax=Coniosporium apollinis TaxID=61459 RepID=A0ABQ9NKQ1_9PEZI|nr:hypothetical protein H2201_008106 [Coniosporium apollinis]
MRDIPIDVYLSFPLPNYDDPQTRGPALVIVNSIFISLVVIAVALRVYTRVYIKRWFGSDDYLICAALVATIGLTTTVLLANTRYCWDRHVWDIPWSVIPGTLKIAFAAKIMFTFAATFIRMSLLQFYYRLTQDSGIRWFTWALHLSHAFNACICISFVALVVFQCNPVSAYWAFPPQLQKCLPEGPVTLGAGIVNCIADLLVASLPIPIVVKLQMPRRQMVGVVMLLSLGFVVTLAGIIRTCFIWKSLMDSYDEMWYAFPLWIAAAVEIDLAMICACAPALRPLVSRYISPTLSPFLARLSVIVPSSLRSPHRSPHSSRPSFVSSKIEKKSPVGSGNGSGAARKYRSLEDGSCEGTTTSSVTYTNFEEEPGSAVGGGGKPWQITKTQCVELSRMDAQEVGKEEGGESSDR